MRLIIGSEEQRIPLMHPLVAYFNEFGFLARLKRRISGIPKETQVDLSYCAKGNLQQIWEFQELTIIRK